MTNILELPFPHGFLVQKGKQTAIASDKKLDIEDQFLVVSDGDVFGNVTLDKPAEMIISEFDRKEYFKEHCIWPRERRQWWPDADKLYVYPITNWEPTETPQIYVDGKVIDEPVLNARQQQMAYKSKQLPKQIVITPDVVGVTEDNEFIANDLVLSDGLKETLFATYETDVKIAGNVNEFMPIYSLALVRNPQMRMLKKSEQEAKAEHMPWRIEIRDGQHCVIKEDDGEVEGCHNTRPEAVAQLAALNINVEEDESSLHADMDKPPKRRRKPKKETKWIDKVKNAATALTDLLTSTEDSKDMDFPEGMFKGNSGFAIKTVNGEPWHFTWSTNAFEDREGEIFTTKSLEQYVIENEQKENRGFFNFWHINKEDGNFSTDFAEKQWQGVVGRFLVEAGPYLDNENGRAALKFFQEFADGHPQIAPEGWGCSPEFRYLPEERAKGVYDWLFIVRTSTLPRAAAANIWTQAKQEENIMALSEEQKEAAIGFFGKERVEALITEGEKRTTDLEQAGIANKENDKSQKDQQPTEINLDMDALAEVIGKQFEVNFGAIGEVVTTLVDGVKELQEKVGQLEKSVTVKEQTETPRYILNVKRATEAEETQVSDDDNLKDEKPKETSQGSGGGADSFFGKK